MTRPLGEERSRQVELVALPSGRNTYLGRVAKVHVSWNGDSLDRLPGRLPVPSAPIREQASVTHRFALNHTDEGYTGAYRDWRDWELEPRRCDDADPERLLGVGVRNGERGLRVREGDRHRVLPRAVRAGLPTSFLTGNNYRCRWKFPSTEDGM